MKHKGFTIIEMLVVISSLALILIATMSFLMSSLSSSGKAESIKEVRQNGEAVLKTARTMLTSSSQVTGCNALPNPAAAITFVSRDDSITIACVTGAADSYIASSSATFPSNSYRLTDRNIAVSNCAIYCLQSASGGAAYVHVSFTLEPSGQSGWKPSERVSQKFETSISLLGI